jgi:hypothetical protein
VAPRAHDRGVPPARARDPRLRADDPLDARLREALRTGGDVAEGPAHRRIDGDRQGTRVRVKYVDVGRPARTKIDLLHRAMEDGLVTGGAGGDGDR